MSEEQDLNEVAGGGSGLNVDLDGVVILVNGGIVAWFAYPDQAHEWARDNYYGRWLMTAYSIPAKPLFTDEQIKKAEDEAREWSEFFNSPNAKVTRER